MSKLSSIHACLLCYPDFSSFYCGLLVCWEFLNRVPLLGKGRQQCGGGKKRGTAVIETMCSLLYFDHTRFKNKVTIPLPSPFGDSGARADGCPVLAGERLLILVRHAQHGRSGVAQLLGARPVEEEAALEGAPRAAAGTSGERKLGRHELGLGKAAIGEEAQHSDVLVDRLDGKVMGLALLSRAGGAGYSGHGGGVGEPLLVAVEVGIGAQHPRVMCGSGGGLGCAAGRGSWRERRHSFLYTQKKIVGGAPCDDLAVRRPRAPGMANFFWPAGIQSRERTKQARTNRKRKGKKEQKK